MQRLLLLTVLGLFINSTLLAHETILRPFDHKVDVDEIFDVAVFTGNFDRSVYPMTEASIEELELHTNKETTEVSPSDWKRMSAGSKWWIFKQKVVGKLGGIDQRDVSLFNMSINSAGSAILAVDFERERVALGLEEYQTYLDTEAFDDLSLKEYGFTEPDDIIVEAYTKIGKTIIQVGDRVTDNVIKPVGQRIELIPLKHPYSIKKGDTMEIQVLHLGKPLPDQSIVVSLEPGAFKDSMDKLKVYKSDDKGTVSFPITKTGTWWANTIFIEPAPTEDGLDFTSLWGSLTFEIN